MQQLGDFFAHIPGFGQIPGAVNPQQPHPGLFNWLGGQGGGGFLGALLHPNSTSSQAQPAWPSSPVLDQLRTGFNDLRNQYTSQIQNTLSPIRQQLSSLPWWNSSNQSTTPWWNNLKQPNLFG